MTQQANHFADPDITQRTSLRVGVYSAILTALITLITFGVAITALPNSGAGCQENCFEYPYLDTLTEYPQDYWWMYLAVIQLLVYVIWLVSIHACTPQPKKIFSQIGLVFGLMAGLILMGDYFVQFSVVPVSLMNGETEGITLLTQYNPHGVFIVLEELGYLLMSLSFLFLAPVFSSKTRLETAVRWIFVAGFALALIALVIVSINYGLERQDRFEVAVISIDWLVLLVNGILIGGVFSAQLKQTSLGAVR
ncbi:MAG: hypothetical protein AB1894_12320 [Chloroflexota bacterium]